MRTDAANLLDAAREIADPELRASQEKAIRAWAEAAPKRSPQRSPCQGCGQEGYQGRGRICSSCMGAIVQNAVNAAREGAISDNAEALSLERARHWNKFPWVDLDDKLPPGHPLFLPEREDEANREASARYVWHNSLQRVLVTALRGFPGVPSGVPTKPLFGGSTFGSDKITGLAPKGFLEAVQHLAFLSAWMVTTARQEGFQKGSNLLVSLAAGTLTMEDMNDRTAREMEGSERRLRDLEKRRMPQ